MPLMIGTVFPENFQLNFLRHFVAEPYAKREKHAVEQYIDTQQEPVINTKLDTDALICESF
jgi:hypothetical protein